MIVDMIMPIIVPLAIHYIKKEDVRAFLIQQRGVEASILMGVAVCVSLIHFLTAPKLAEMYSDLNIIPPILVQYSIIITATLLIFCILVSLSLLFTQPDCAQVDEKLKKFDNGEMIKTSEIISTWMPWLFIGSLILMGIYIIFSTIMPVYWLTNQF